MGKNKRGKPIVSTEGGLKFKTFTFLLLSVIILSFQFVAAATSPTEGTASSFAVLAATAITNVPTSSIIGDVGLSPAAGSNYAGLTALEVTGTIYAVDATGPAGSVDNPGLLTTAKADLVTAYDALASQGCDVTYLGTKDLVGENLVPGVYCADAFTLSGTLTLSGSTGVWVFKSSSTLITSGTANVVGGNSCNVWWQVGSSATLGTNTDLIGNILALTSIGLNTGASLTGQALARNGAVTLDSNTITLSNCSEEIGGDGIDNDGDGLIDEGFDRSIPVMSDNLIIILLVFTLILGLYGLKRYGK